MTNYSFRAIEAFSPQITVRQVLILELLKNRPFRLKEISHELNLPKSAVSRSFDALGIRGFMRRVRDENDARNVYGMITPEGISFMDRIKQ